MKHIQKVLLIAMTLFFAAHIVKAQVQDKDAEVKTVIIKEENSDSYYYEDIVPVNNITKEEMFGRAKAWVLSTLKTVDNNVQFDEKEMSIYNSSTVLLKNANEYLNFKISILFKDGKYKFRFDNLIVSIPSSVGLFTKPYGPNMFAKGYSKKKMKECNEILYSLSTNLENTIKGTGTKKSDW